jgi:hypothetical protein
MSRASIRSREKMYLKKGSVNMRLGWIGTVAFQVIDDNRELLFDLAEGQAVPPEFNEGDEVWVINHPDHPANLSMGNNSGYYEITHIASGKTFEVLHSAGERRLR